MDWNIDTDDPANSNSELTPRQRAYITRGDTGKHSGEAKEKMIRGIAEKAEKLPQRINYLIKDIVLFDYYDALEFENPNPDGRSELYTPYGSEGIAAEYNGITQIDTPAGESSAINLGIDLGSALRLIFEANNDTDAYRDFLLGIILSEIEPKLKEGEQGTQQLKTLLKEFRKKHDEHASFKSGVEWAMKNQKAKINELRGAAKEELISYDIEPSEELLHVVIKQQYSLETGFSTENGSPPEKEVKKLVDQNELIFRTLEYMQYCIESDIEYIHNTKPVGIPARDLLQSVWKQIQLPADRYVNINNIEDEHGKPQKEVTRALRHLHSHYDRVEGPKYAITRETESHLWGLTGYGKIIAKCMFGEAKLQQIYLRLFERIIENKNKSPHRIEIGDNSAEKTLNNTHPYYLELKPQKNIYIPEEGLIEILMDVTDRKYEYLLSNDLELVITEAEELIEENYESTR